MPVIVEPDDELLLEEREIDADDVLELVDELEDELLDTSLDGDAWLVSPDAPEEAAASLVRLAEQPASANTAIVMASATASALVQVPDCISSSYPLAYVKRS